MILKVEGNINRYYVQTLCLVFFPGSTFGENEVSGEGIPEVSVNVYNDNDGGVTSYVSMKLNDRVCDATASVAAEEEVNIATKESIAVGRALFSAGKELLGHIPPWGILTGVRPAKIASSLIRSGNGITKSKRILRDEYFLNPQKAALAVSVAAMLSMVTVGSLVNCMNELLMTIVAFVAHELALPVFSIGKVSFAVSPGSRRPLPLPLSSVIVTLPILNSGA